MGVQIQLSLTGLQLYRLENSTITGKRLAADSVTTYLPRIHGAHRHVPTLAFHANCWLGRDASRPNEVKAADIETIVAPDGTAFGLVTLEDKVAKLPNLVETGKVTMDWETPSNGHHPSGKPPKPPVENASWIVDLAKLGAPSSQLKPGCDSLPLQSKNPVVSRLEMKHGTFASQRVAKKFIGGKLSHLPINFHPSDTSKSVWSQGLTEETVFSTECRQQFCQLTLIRSLTDFQTVTLQAPAGSPNLLHLAIGHLPPHPESPSTNAKFAKHFDHLYDLLLQPPTDRPLPIVPAGGLDLPANSLCPPALVRT